jgi:hypothetical protein
MLQLAGGVTTDQVSPTALDEDAVAVKPVGAEGIALQVPPCVDPLPCAEAADVPKPSTASTT